jgi:hypothetical protein
VKVFLIAALSIVVIAPGCAVRLGRMSDNQRSERLAIERGKLAELKNPVERTRSYIRIARLLLDFVAGAARDHDTEAMVSLVDQYTSAIQSARDSIVNTDRDAARNAAGFKDLEVALRQDIRRLQDVNAGLTVDERRPVAHALEVTNSIREELLRLLFR